MVMASLLFVKRMATIQQNNMLITQTLEQLQDLTPLKADRLAYAAGRITLFHVIGPMRFGSAWDFARVLQGSGNRDILVINLADVTFIDSSASIMLKESSWISRTRGRRCYWTVRVETSGMCCPPSAFSSC